MLEYFADSAKLLRTKQPVPVDGTMLWASMNVHSIVKRSSLDTSTLFGRSRHLAVGEPTREDEVFARYDNMVVHNPLGLDPQDSTA